MRTEDYYNIERTEELTNALSNYDGVVPILLLPHVDFLVYDEHLKGLDNYEEIMEEFGDVRLGLLGAEDKDVYRIKQFEEWLKDNEDFKDLIEF